MNFFSPRNVIPENAVVTTYHAQTVEQAKSKNLVKSLKNFE